MHQVGLIIWLLWSIVQAQNIPIEPAAAKVPDVPKVNETENKVFLDLGVQAKVNNTSGKPSNNVEIHVAEPEKPHENNIEPGAFVRGVWVFVGLSLLFVVFIGIKTCRKRNKAIIVKKYGVRTRRSDIEMEPLPLDEDEDDETLFDLKHVNNYTR